MKAEVTQRNMLDMQVCVPTSWTDAEVIAFANAENPSGLEAGWQIRKEGDDALRGAPERRTCGEREGFVHIMLDA